MKRVVKPGGWLLIAEIDSDKPNEAQGNQKIWHHLKVMSTINEELHTVKHGRNLNYLK